MQALVALHGRIANENVTVELLIKKCLPTLLYTFEVCPLNNSEIRALDYVVDRVTTRTWKPGKVREFKKGREKSGKMEKSGNPCWTSYDNIL